LSKFPIFWAEGELITRESVRLDTIWSRAWLDNLAMIETDADIYSQEDEMATVFIEVRC
jgi:hypothetical protein